MSSAGSVGLGTGPKELQLQVFVDGVEEAVFGGKLGATEH